MSYLVLARKWRPQQLDEVVAQRHITTTLKNAIQQKRIAHSYLFTGPRGVGKTTTARILAKALNCEQGPTPTPCNRCRSCGEITKGSSLDVLEIDGASNRGIDEIRNLRENVKYAPSGGKYKIYIIDEVHMLTAEAFNALLKTLEEPPAQVVFVLATTRPQKVPSTIISRCLRFDFHRIPTREIAKHLSFIATQEGIEVEEEALLTIARKAEGSMRDGQSIFDQIISYQGKKILQEDLKEILGLIDQDVLFGLTQAILQGETSKGLAILEEVETQGYDLLEFAHSLVGHLRNLLLAKLSQPLDLSPEEMKRYGGEAQGLDEGHLLRLIKIAQDAEREAKRSAQPRLDLDLAVVKMAKLDSTVHLKEILEKLEMGNPPRKEAKLKGMEGKPSPSPVEERSENRTWEELLARIKAHKISLGTLLAEGKYLGEEGGKVRVAFYNNHNFHRVQVVKPHNHRLIEEEASNLWGKKITLEVEAKEEEQLQSKVLEMESPSTRLSRLTDKEPIIERVLDIFDGQIIETKPRKEKRK
jgi:DNA polymerase-3 subunit gamma/tau